MDKVQKPISLIQKPSSEPFRIYLIVPWLAYFFDSENGSDMFLRNAYRLSVVARHYTPEDKSLK
jgi:hypothetical protein